MDRETMLDAAEIVIARQGIANVTLEAVAMQAGISKGGLLHHFRSKDHLVEALVRRCARNWQSYYTEAYERMPEGPGRLARALLDSCLGDAQAWTERLRRSSASIFAALAHDPALIEPMREVYADLRQRIVDDGLPPGVGEAVLAATDGMWLHWTLGLVPLDQALLDRVRPALETLLESACAAAATTRKPAPRRAAGRRR